MATIIMTTVVVSANTQSAKPVDRPIAKTSVADCAFTGDPRDWATKAIDAWGRQESERLHVKAPQHPIIEFFDSRCLYTLTPATDGAYKAGGRAFTVRAEAHGDTIDPGVEDPFPVGKIAFTSTEHDGKPLTFVIALPELWDFGPKDPRNPGTTFMNVFMHEFSHVQHTAALKDILSHTGGEGSGGGDAVQSKFRSNPDYVADYEHERDEFLAAVNAPDREHALEHLKLAADLMAHRRAKWFKDDPKLALLDDVFLTMEGAGQWSAWTWSVDPRGGAQAEETAFRQTRTRRWWQDEGFLILRALDRVTPDWPQLTFNAPGLTIDALIRRALTPERTP
jgi:hypothetical protein